MTDDELLRLRIAESGLTIERFAREVLLRPPRTVKRWLAGDSPISQVPREWLKHPLRHPWP